MELTTEERTRVFGGDLTALKRRDRPEWAEGDHQVLRWSRARTVVADRETGATAHYPRQPLLTVYFQEPIRHKDGGWRVPIRIEDQRAPTRFLGPQAPPPLDVELTAETARGYRSTPAGAIDDLEAVDDDELHRQKVRSMERFAEHQDQHEAEERMRRQERAVRQQLKQIVRDLPLPAGQALLAAIEREIRRAMDQ